MLRGAAALLRFSEQRLIVLLRGLEPIWAHDPLARVVAIAVSPRSGARGIFADQRAVQRTSLRLERQRAVAAEVPLVGPQCAIGVEVLRREKVDGQRLHARRRGALG